MDINGVFASLLEGSVLLVINQVCGILEMTQRRVEATREGLRRAGMSRDEHKRAEMGTDEQRWAQTSTDEQRRVSWTLLRLS